MNAPWRASNRNPFAAFLCDEASITTLRPIVGEIGWPPELCQKGSLRNAIQTLSMSPSPNILMVDLSDSSEPLIDINALAEVCEPGTMVIAVGQVNDVRLYRDLIASGVHDYLLKPFSPTHLRDTLIQAQTVFTSPHAHDATRKAHTSIAVVGARGGVGVSTMATSLAWAFSANYRQSTALLDLDIHFGTAALTLDLEPGHGLIDVIENPSRIDSLFIERAMIRANDNLAILSSEAQLSQPVLSDGMAFLLLLEEFRRSFDVSVIDLPRNILINFPNLLNNVNVFVLVTEMTLAGARDSIRILSWLKTYMPQLQVLIVVNKIHPANTEITRADFEASIERRINFQLPFDHKAASQAAKLGRTFLEANRSSKLSATILDIASMARRYGDVDGDDIFEDDTRKSLLGKIDLKGMLSNRDTPKGPVKKRKSSAGVS